VEISLMSIMDLERERI